MHSVKFWLWPYPQGVFAFHHLSSKYSYVTLRLNLRLMSQLVLLLLVECISHPTETPPSPIPPAGAPLRAANGSPTEVSEFVWHPLTLGNVTRRVGALVAPLLGPDLLLLDNNCISTIGPTLDQPNDALSQTVGRIILAMHRIRDSTHFPAVCAKRRSSVSTC